MVFKVSPVTGVVDQHLLEHVKTFKVKFYPFSRCFLIDFYRFYSKIPTPKNGNTVKNDEVTTKSENTEQVLDRTVSLKVDQVPVLY